MSDPQSVHIPGADKGKLRRFSAQDASTLNKSSSLVVPNASSLNQSSSLAVPNASSLNQSSSLAVPNASSLNQSSSLVVPNASSLNKPSGSVVSDTSSDYQSAVWDGEQLDEHIEVNAREHVSDNRERTDDTKYGHVADKQDHTYAKSGQITDKEHHAESKPGHLTHVDTSSHKSKFTSSSGSIKNRFLDLVQYETNSIVDAASSTGSDHDNGTEVDIQMAKTKRIQFPNEEEIDTPKTEDKYIDNEIETDIDMVMADLANELLDTERKESLSHTHNVDFTRGTSYFRKLNVLKHTAIKTVADRRTRKRWEPMKTERPEERETWPKGFSFAMVLLQNVVGYGNMGYVNAHLQHGRAAFLIPYVFFLVLFGLPVFITEIAQGQFTGFGATRSWDFARLFQGIGFSMVIYAFLNSIYYIVRVATSLNYLFNLHKSPLPWTSCRQEDGEPNQWNTYNCRELEDLENNGFQLNITSVYEYFHRYVKKREHDVSVGELGEFNEELVLYLLVSCVFVFIAITIKIKHSATLALVMTVLGCSLAIMLFLNRILIEGAFDGIAYFWEAEWKELLSLKTWQAGALTIYYTLSLTWGTNICISSFSKFHHDILKTAFVVACSDCFVNLFFATIQMSSHGTFAKFSGVSFAEYIQKIETNKDFGIDEFLFVNLVYLVQANDHQGVWYAVLFISFFLLGLGTMYPTVMAFTSGLADLLPPDSVRDRWIAAATCLLIFLSGIFLCQSGDNQNFAGVLQFYTGGIVSPILSAMHLFSWAYIYGSDRFLDDIHSMLGDHVFFELVPFNSFRVWLSFSLKYLTQASFIFIMVINITEYSPPPVTATSMGVLVTVLGHVIRVMMLLPILLVPAFHFMRDKEGSIRDRLQRLITPTDDWGPLREKDRIASRYQLTKAQRKLRSTSTKDTSKKTFRSLLGRSRSTLSSSPGSSKMHNTHVSKKDTSNMIENDIPLSFGDEITNSSKT